MEAAKTMQINICFSNLPSRFNTSASDNTGLNPARTKFPCSSRSSTRSSSEPSTESQDDAHQLTRKFDKALGTLKAAKTPKQHARKTKIGENRLKDAESEDAPDRPLHCWRGLNPACPQLEWPKRWSFEPLSQSTLADEHSIRIQWNVLWKLSFLISFDSCQLSEIEIWFGHFPCSNHSF